MQHFIPMTDELIDQLPGQARLVPYRVDLPCFRWALVDAGGDPLKGPAPSRRPASRPADEPCRR